MGFNSFDIFNLFTPAARRWSVTTNNVAALPGSRTAMSITNIASTFEFGAAIATWDGTNIVVTSTDAPVKLEALIHTTGTGSHSAAFFFRNTNDTVATRFGDGLIPNGVSSSGVYGQGSNNTCATAVVPPDTTVTLHLVHNASSNNQIVNAGSYLFVSEVRSSNTTAANGTPQIPIVTDIITSGTFVRDPLCRFLEIKAVGGSGGGGYGFGAAAANQIYLGIGSASGAYIHFLISAADFGASQLITIGAAGAANGGGGSTSIGSLATATGSIAGANIYANCDTNLTTAFLCSSANPPTFTLSSACKDIGSCNGQHPSFAHATLQSNTTSIIVTSEGGRSPFGNGGKSIPARTNGRTSGNASANAVSPPGSNTGAGASGDCTYSTNSSAGAASTAAAGSAGRVCIVQYF